MTDKKGYHRRKKNAFSASSGVFGLLLAVYHSNDC